MIIRTKLKINCDQRGKITAGYKGISAQGKEIPKSTDFFVLKNPETKEEKFPELVEIYGEKPTQFLIAFPSNNISDFYEDNFCIYGSNNVKKRRCNGQEVEIFYDETIIDKDKNVVYKLHAGTIEECVCKKLNLFDTEDSELKKYCCKAEMYLKAYILDPRTDSPRYLKAVSPLCYLFSSNSINSADNIFSTLQMFKSVLGFPFVLSVKRVKTSNTSFPILSLFPYITEKNLIEYNMNYELSDSVQKALLLKSHISEETTEKKKNEAKKEYNKEALIAKIKEAETVDELKDLWDVNWHFQDDKTVRTEFINRKNKINKK